MMNSTLADQSQADARSLTEPAAPVGPAAAAPRRILRVLTRLNIGGPAIHAAILSARLDPRRFSTCLVVGNPDASEGDLSGLIQDPSVRFIRLGTLKRALRPWADLLTLVRLWRIIRREQPSLIHTHMAKAGTLGRLAGLLSNRFGPRRAVLVHTFHGHVLDGYFSSWSSRLFIAIERWLARRTDRLVAVSPAIRQELLALGIGRAEQWRVVPVGLDLSELERMPAPAGAAAVRFGIIGRLVPIKNVPLFLHGFQQAQACAAECAMTAVVVGDGPIRAELERESARLGVASTVRFAGWRRDLPAVYADVDVACVTSWNEGTPVALIEAMAAGRAVIATQVGGVRDVLCGAGAAPAAIAPGAFHAASRGLLVNAGDAEGLAAAMSALAADAVLRRRLGESARAHVCEHFSQDRLVRDITALYEELR